MPPGQTTPLGDAAVSARRRQPAKFGNGIGRQRNTVGHLGLPVRIVSTPAGVQIQQRAREPCQINIAGVFILDFKQTTAPASVAERFPLSRRHLAERLLLPEACRSVFHRPGICRRRDRLHGCHSPSGVRSRVGPTFEKGAPGAGHRRDARAAQDGQLAASHAVGKLQLLRPPTCGTAPAFHATA